MREDDKLRMIAIMEETMKSSDGDEDGVDVMTVGKINSSVKIVATRQENNNKE